MNRHTALIKVIITLSILIIICSVHGCIKKNSETDDRYANYETQPEVQTGNKHVYIIPSSYWPRINILRMGSAIVVFLALLTGAMMYIIGRFSGAKLNKNKINASVAIAGAVGLLGRSFTIWLQVEFANLLDKVINNPLVSGTIADSVIYIFWIVFIAGIAVNSYETFVVSAKEAHPMG